VCVCVCAYEHAAGQIGVGVDVGFITVCGYWRVGGGSSWCGDLRPVS
jgi:hypothetical protein